jgi:hypothetical protein
MADTPHTPGTPGDHGHKDDPMAQLWMAMSGASAGGHHEEVPGVDAASAKVGHEPDQFNAKTIVYVPIVVAVVLVFTYLIVQGAFAFVNGKEAAQRPELTTDSTDPAEIERVKKENQTREKDWNERSGRTRNWTADPVAKSSPADQPQPPVAQPQLEYNKQVDLTRKTIDGKVVTDPPFLRSFPDQGKNNAPVIYPEDLRPENYTDPWHGDAKLLAEPMWVKGHEGKLAVVPIDEMIHLVTHDAKWKGTLKVAEKPTTVVPGTLGKPKLSAGGLAGPVPATDKNDDGHGHK